MAGEGRLDLARWRQAARSGAPRAASAGGAGGACRLSRRSGADATARLRQGAAAWWPATRALLAPLEAAFEAATSLPASLAALREAATRLAGDAAWSGTAGRAAADLLADLEAAAGEGPERIEAAHLPDMLERLMREVAVRPPYGQHPRIAIWGLLEARLQHADLLVLGGLNEGVWPALPAPDPWLAPRIRAELGLPSLERRIGLAAHDFATALGARQVLVTRARRDARAPAIASRFWLRLEAMTGGLTRAPDLRKWARAIDRAGTTEPAHRPGARARSGAAARRNLGDRGRSAQGRSLCLLRPQDAGADGARSGRRRSERGLAGQRRPCRPRSLDEGGRLRPREAARARRGAASVAGGAPADARALAAAADRGDRLHRRPGRGESRRGPAAAGGGDLGQGRDSARSRSAASADRIDRLADGGLAIVDYKTGSPPSGKAVQRRLFAPARPARPDRRAGRLRGDRGRRRLLRILEPGARPAFGAARLCEEPGRRAERARRRRIHRPRAAQLRCGARQNG